MILRIIALLIVLIAFATVRVILNEYNVPSSIITIVIFLIVVSTAGYIRIHFNK